MVKLTSFSSVAISKHFMFTVNVTSESNKDKKEKFQNISCLRLILIDAETYFNGSKFQNISCLRLIVNKKFKGGYLY